MYDEEQFLYVFLSKISSKLLELLLLCYVCAGHYVCLL